MENQIYLWSITAVVYILLVVGAVGSFVPVVPGPLLAGAGIFCVKVFAPDFPVSWSLAVASLVVAVLAQLVDFAATWLGAKKFGATWRGVLGAFVGVIAGMFIPPPLFWIFVAPLVFALLFEWMGGASFEAATRAGVGAFIGSVLSSVLKFAMMVFLAAWFTFGLWSAVAAQ